ncbi:MAG: hypothetical protein IJW20_02440 [Clostridia bacterium]|nr:hypothetical protein [Clostridia bacterium]
MKIIYGTTNKAKVEAMYGIVKNYGFDAEIFTLKDIGFTDEIIEDGTTFEENSLIKAKAISEFCKKNNITDKIILTDDAGLCVDYLNGAPGIYTGRYAGDHAPQIDNINKLLENMKECTKLEDRSCKLVCVLTAILTDGSTFNARGECTGTIAFEHGKLGGLTFGPVFIPKGFDKPMGDMDESEYIAVHNHRDLAMNELMNKFKELGY